MGCSDTDQVAVAERAPEQRTGPVLGRGVVSALFLLAGVFAVALTFATIELPRWVAGWTDSWIEIPDYHPAIEPEAINDFLSTSYVRPIGYACLAIVVLLILVGLITKRVGLSKAGAVLLFLPTFGFFATHMFFLAGLGVLRALWLPAWSDWLALGDVAYAPYMAIVWPLSQLGLDVRYGVATGAIALGLLLFTVSTGGWLVARAQGGEVVNFWTYRFSRHPQYLAWILWSWGMMLLAGLQPVPLGGENPGAALPWVITTLVIIAVAWGEEARMLGKHGSEYSNYRDQTPFLFPVPHRLRRGLTAPLRSLLGKDAPETGLELVIAFAIYLSVAMLLSLPFVLFDWPPLGWWYWPT